jgi:hypothetical protein
VADGCQPSFFDFTVLRYVFFYLLHVRSRCIGFAQKHQATLKKAVLRSESSSYAQNTATYAQKPFCIPFLSMKKGFKLLTKEKN